MLYLSSFYPRFTYQLRYDLIQHVSEYVLMSYRISVLLSAASFTGAFSGLLAAAIAQMHGVRNKPGWAWIFILVVASPHFPPNH